MARPLADRILIKPDEPKENYAGGLRIPDEKPTTGKVIATGRGKIGNNDLPIPVEPKTGETVLYGKYSGIEVTIEDEDFLLIRETDILMIMDYQK